ncbi:hypothetical protein RRF57_013099 [Xylaria bambusicola]|uniref:Uncharacterized protein n=1 Tax=Xylaria bambusicola TaxID=326684 RepID=A0AAN7ZB95_9PEZI
MPFPANPGIFPNSPANRPRLFDPGRWARVVYIFWPFPKTNKSGGTRSFVEGSSDPSQLARGFLSTAVQAVQDHLDNNPTNPKNGGQRDTGKL